MARTRVLDAFDLVLTAESLALDIPLSPSAIARRLRRLRAEGWIERTIALLGPKLTRNRLRAIVLIRFDDIPARVAFERRVTTEPPISFCYEIADPYDSIAFFDCANMAEFNAIADDLLASPGVRRYDTHFVKREVKFAPFVQLIAD